jgi:hypothetical protein
MQLMTALRLHDDVSTALSALLEGDASLTMFAAMPSGARTVSDAERARLFLYREAARPGSELALEPRFLAASLIFPSADGTVLAAQHFQAGGNAGLDQAMREPPLSSLRVLFPDDLAPVEFVRLPLEQLVSRLAPTPCSVGSENTVGANALRVLFEADPADADRSARGAVERRPLRAARLRRKWEVVWLTRWRSPEAAQTFAARYRELAPAIAARAPLSGTAEVVVDGRTALVVTPGLRAQAEWLHGASEIRSYGSFADWLGDGCFPEAASPPAE